MDTKLFVRRQPGGMLAVTDREFNPSGTVFWVHAGTGRDGAGYGRNPDAPVATLDYAVGLCTASKGDVIYLMPGHAETLAGATACVLDVAGVKVVGLGWGTLKPVLTLSATAAIVSITAANCWLENVRLVGAIDNIVTAISLGALADGAVLRGIEIVDGATNKEFLIGVAIAAACHDVTIDGLRFYGLAGGATGAIVAAGAANNLRVVNCFIAGTFSTALLDVSAAASSNLLIANNYLANRDAGAGLVIKGHATNTGIAAYNVLGGVKSNTETFNTPGTLMCFQNFGTDTAGTTGILTPSTLTAWT